MFFKEYTTKLWGRTPSEIDSSWGSQRVKGISIRKVLIDYFMRLFKLENKNKETLNSFRYHNGTGFYIFKKLSLFGRKRKLDITPKSENGGGRYAFTARKSRRLFLFAPRQKLQDLPRFGNAHKLRRGTRYPVFARKERAGTAREMAERERQTYLVRAHGRKGAGDGHGV